MNNLNFEGQNIYAGFDVHLKGWKVTILSEEMMLKTFTMPSKPEVLSAYLLRNYPGAIYHLAYEAGFCGLWAHYQLCELGIKNIVVNPADIFGTASFIGLIPMTKSSGEKQKVGEITFRAHNFFRSIIIESSWVAVSRDPALPSC
jgi:hypothetical protein